MALQERAKRVEALIEFLSELLKEAAPARGAARKLLADVYARYCLEPIAGVSTRGAFERELAVAYALAERGLGWSEELEKLANVFKVEQACSRALGLILAGSKPVEALEGAGARLSGAWVRALLGYARALHYLGYLGDAELAALFKALEEAGAGDHLRSSRKLAAAHKLAQLIASGQVAGRRRKEERKRALALLYGGGNEDRPSDALVWQVAVNVYGLEESKAFKLLKMSRARLVASVSNSASWWYRLVASYSELKDATAKLDPLWQEALRVAAGRVGSLLPAAGAPAALALLEQAAAEGLDPDGFFAKLDKLLGAGGDPVELLLSWDAQGWRLSALLLATRAFEVKLERGYEMLVVDRVAAEEALEAGVKGLAGRLEAKLKEAVAAAGPRGGVAERWLKLVSLLLALEIVGRACELPPPPEAQEAGEAREAGYKAVRARRSGWRRGCRRGREEGWKEVPGGQRVREKDRGRAVRRPQESSGDPAESPRQQLTEKHETGSQNRASTATPKDRRAGNRNRAKAARRNRRKRAKPTGYRTPETGIVTVTIE